MILPYPFFDSLAMFFIYSFIGWVIEVVYYGVTEGQFINRGFLNGPLCPVYGLAFYSALWFFEPLKDNFLIIFFGGSFACTVVELIVGVILYHIFHLRWWDYSNYKMNFHGYICMRFYFYWGIACSFGVYVLHPTVLYSVSHIPDVVLYIFLAVASIFLIIDLIATVSAILKFSEKLKTFNSVAAEFKSASDKIGGSIYGAVDTIVTTNQPAVEGYANYRKMVADHKAEEEALAKKHKEEERKYIDAFLSSEKELYLNTSKAAKDKMLNLVKGLRVPEKRLLQVISTGGPQTVYTSALKTIKEKYYKSSIYKRYKDMVAEDPDAELSKETDEVSV